MKKDNLISKLLAKKMILVVGGSGFLGTALVKKLYMHGATVVSLDLKETKQREIVRDIKTINIDFRDSTSLKDLLTDYTFEYVFNAGGYIDHSPFFKGGRSVIDSHYVGTLNLIENVYSSYLKKFIQIGSSDEYGNGSAPQKEDMREAPIAPYSAAKVAATHLVQTLARTEKFPGVAVRLFLVYGPGQNQQRFLPQIIMGCLQNRTFPVSEGEQLRDFCYIDDVIDGLIKSAINENTVGKVINLASGKPVSIKNVINKVVELVGKGEPDFGAYSYRTRENMELYADISIAKRLLDWKPQITLEEGLKKTVDYYRNSIQGGQ